MRPCFRRDDTDVIGCDKRDAFAHGSESDERTTSPPSLRGAKATKQSNFLLRRTMDCFAALAIRFMVARWLATTISHERRTPSIFSRLRRILAGLHQAQAFLDLAKYAREVHPLLCGEAG